MTIEQNPDEMDVLEFGPAPGRRIPRRGDQHPDGDAPAGELRLNLDEAPPPPPPSDPARIRRVRASMIGAGLLAVGVGGLAMRSAPPPMADEPPQATAVTPGKDGLEMMSVRFADARRGYALASACTPGTTRICKYLFRTTADGGGTWEFQPVPLTSALLPRDPQPTITTFGERGVRISAAGGRWYSLDAGRTWQEPPEGPTSEIAQAPAGAVVDVPCRPLCGPVRVTDPRTGLRPPLSRQPDINLLSTIGPLPRPADGSLWVTGRLAADGPPAVAVSSNGGRSWRVSRLAETEAPLDSVTVITRDGRTAYAFVVTAGPADAADASQRSVVNGLAAIHVTTDGGATWSVVPDSMSDSQGQPGSLVAAVLMPTGRILVATEEYGQANLRYSDDGGRTFPRLIEESQPQFIGLEAAGDLAAAGDRYLATGLYGGFYTSTDAVHWQRVRL